MTSKLGYAILALLARQPSTGYELSARARRPLSYFWFARHSQVYPELQKLLDAELVSFSLAPGPGPLDKKVYSLTPAGLDLLREWVIAVPEPAPVRNDLLLKAYASWTTDPAAAAGLFAGQVGQHEQQLASYQREQQAVESQHSSGPPPVTHPDFGSYATLRYGIGIERQRIEWLTWISQQFASAAPARGR